MSLLADALALRARMAGRPEAPVLIQQADIDRGDQCPMCDSRRTHVRGQDFECLSCAHEWGYDDGMPYGREGT